VLSVGKSPSDLGLLTWTSEGRPGDVSDEAEEAYRAMAAALGEASSVVLQERVFGDLQSAGGVAVGRARALGTASAAWVVPPTYVEGAPAGRRGLAGIHVLTARAEDSRLVTEGERVLGRAADLPGARLLGLYDVGRLGSGPSSLGPQEDAANALDAAQRTLESSGFSFRDVIRTWFYLRDILDWYGPFNRVRSEAFRRMGLMGGNGDGAIPASTGIEGRNARGGWCTLDLIAAQPRGDQPFEMRRLHNSLQSEATRYGSAFARGMALTLGACRYVFVSGTASIDDQGRSTHFGDFEAQTRQTVDAVGALLGSAGASLRDVCQATAFLKNARDARSFERIAARMGLDAVPTVVTVADVCREELLVEIDATALVPGDASPPRQRV